MEVHNSIIPPYNLVDVKTIDDLLLPRNVGIVAANMTNDSGKRQITELFVTSLLIKEGTSFQEKNTDRSYQMLLPLMKAMDVHIAVEAPFTPIEKLTIEAIKLAESEGEGSASYAAKLIVIGDYLRANPDKINERSQFNITALHCAAEAGLQSLTHLLLEFNPDLNAKNDLGQTPEERARKFHHEAIADMLQPKKET